MIPATQDPVALSEAIGGGKVVVGKRGDTMMERDVPTRRGKARKVAMFDPFIEPGLDDSCVEVVRGEFTCDNLRSSKRETKQQAGKIKYPDGTAQTIRPTVLSPDIFIAEGLEFEGVENLVYNVNGTFYVVYKGTAFLLIPKVDIKSEEVPTGQFIESNIELEANGQLKYTVPVENPETDDKQDNTEVLIFELNIEQVPDGMCTEPVPGEIVCSFA